MSSNLNMARRPFLSTLLTIALLSLIFTFFCPSLSLAAPIRLWATNGVAVAAAGADEWAYGVVSDGSEGAIIDWNFGGMIYARRVKANGTLATEWLGSWGVLICKPTYQWKRDIDGSGGVIWATDGLGVMSDIYARKLDVNGQNVSGWSTGVIICNAADNQVYPSMVSDGSGGAVITWRDFSRGNHTHDIYAQKVNQSGVRLWTTMGVTICAINQSVHEELRSTPMVGDSSGGAIIAWSDYRSGNYDIYARRINGSGTPQWTTNGVIICAAAGDQSNVAMVSDGSGGAVITWVDPGSGNFKIYAQRINSYGTPEWTAGGVKICDASGEGTYVGSPDIIWPVASDGSGGAIIAWLDKRNGNYDVYAQRIDQSGSLRWTANGVKICTTSSSALVPYGIVVDGSGGAFMVWSDVRTGPGTARVYAQRINADGTLLWPVSGFPVTLIANPKQNFSEMTNDGAGGAILTWEDQRNGNSDVYAQRIADDGLPVGTMPIISDFRVDGVSTGDAISCQPRVWVTITGEVSPYNITTIELSIDGHTYSYSTMEVDYDNITGRLIYRFPDKYPKGYYTITVRAWNIDGNMVEASVSDLEIKSSAGAPEIVDTPRADYPQWTAGDPPGTKLAYTLNNDADINIYVYKDKKVLYKKHISSGSPGGGMGGYNEVFWDGRAGDGSQLGIGIYTVVITSKNDKLGEVTIMVTP